MHSMSNIKFAICWTGWEITYAVWQR